MTKYLNVDHKSFLPSSQKYNSHWVGSVNWHFNFIWNVFNDWIGPWDFNFSDNLEDKSLTVCSVLQKLNHSFINYLNWNFLFVDDRVGLWHVNWIWNLLDYFVWCWHINCQIMSQSELTVFNLSIFTFDWIRSVNRNVHCVWNFFLDGIWSWNMNRHFHVFFRMNWNLTMNKFKNLIFFLEIKKILTCLTTS